MLPGEELPRPEEIVLTFVKVAARQHLDDLFLHDLKVTAERNPVTDQIAVAIRAKVLAEELPPEFIRVTAPAYVDLPTSTWQFFKDRHSTSWWLGWWCRRWPAKTLRTAVVGYATVELTKFITYPEARITVPQLGPGRRGFTIYVMPPASWRPA